MASVFVSQVEEYRRLLGREPAHFNGHKHFHLSLNMIFGGVLPIGSTVRRSFTFSKGDKSPLNRFYRRLVDAWLIKRHISTDAFFSLSPTNDVSRLARIVALAQTRSVELMVHPWSPDHFALLTGSEFPPAKASAFLGSRRSQIQTGCRSRPFEVKGPSSGRSAGEHLLDERKEAEYGLESPKEDRYQGHIKDRVQD